MTQDYAAVLDACVLVNAGLRDTLLRLAETPRLYLPKWSDDILDEMCRTLQNTSFKKSEQQTNHLRDELLRAFPEAWVTGYKSIEPRLTNDPKDRHVLAAAIRSSAQTIVTFNLKHFPAAVLEEFDIEAIHPDEFLVNQFHLDDTLVTRKFAEQAAAIGRSVDEQLRAFHKTRALPLFVQTLSDALSVPL